MSDKRSYYLTPVFGGISGVIADVVTHPVATIKTRLNVQGSAKGTALESATVYRNGIHAVSSMIRTEGVTSLFSGVGAVIGGAPFASGFYFCGVEATKNILGSGAAADFTSGVAGQLAGSLAWVPMDVIKERAMIIGQIHTVDSNNSSVSVMKGIVRSEGVLGLYRAYLIHQITWAPFNGIYWMVYNRSKQECSQSLGLLSTSKTASFALSSCVAGTVASVSTAPLDLVKTRLQVQRANPHLFDFQGPLGCARKVLQSEGILAFFDGVTARVLWLTPRYIVAVSLFDLFKDKFLSDQSPSALLSDDDDNDGTPLYQ